MCIRDSVYIILTDPGRFNLHQESVFVFHELDYPVLVNALMGMMLSMKLSGSRNFAMVVSPFMDLRRKRYINTDLSMTFGVRRNLKKNASSKKRIAKKIHCPRSNNRMNVIMRSDNITKKVTMNTYLTGRPFHSSRIRVMLFGTVLFAIYILLHIPTPTILLTRDLPTMQTIPITTNSIMSANCLLYTSDA